MRIHHTLLGLAFLSLIILGGCTPGQIARAEAAADKAEQLFAKAADTVAQLEGRGDDARKALEVAKKYSDSQMVADAQVALAKVEDALPIARASMTAMAETAKATRETCESAKRGAGLFEMLVIIGTTIIGTAVPTVAAAVAARRKAKSMEVALTDAAAYGDQARDRLSPEDRDTIGMMHKMNQINNGTYDVIRSVRT